MGGYDFTLHCNGKALTLVLSANTHICGARTKEVGTRRTTSSEKLMQEGRKVLRKKKKKHQTVQLWGRTADERKSADEM